MSKQIFLAFDADSAGRMVGRAVIADDVQGIKDVSGRIGHGQDLIAAWAKSFDAEQISFGGDESSYAINSDCLDSLEQLRSDYHFATGLTVTVGVGMKLSEAGKALIVGKLRGKNQVCQYDGSVEQEFAQAEQGAEDGTATGEGKKLGEAYLSKQGDEMKNDPNQPATDDSHDDCQYCNDLKGSGDSDPDHCGSCHDEGDDCPYCQETEAHDPTSDDHLADCPYCQEMAAHDPTSEDHADDCPYCAAMGEPPMDAEGETENESDGSEFADEGPILSGAGQSGGDVSPSITDDPAEHSAEGMDAILDQIVNEDGEGNPIQATSPEGMDDAAEPVGTDMEGNTSRPEGFSDGTPGDMGIEDNQMDATAQPGGQDPNASPDLGAVLQDGLNDQADSIQQERVMSMVGEALQGFKANKMYLEQAKDQAPQLYQSTIQMLKAMIEMAKLLGLDSSPVQTPDQAPVPQPSAAPAPTTGGAPVDPKQKGQ